jgi:hypothetical protein
VAFVSRRQPDAAGLGRAGRRYGVPRQRLNDIRAPRAEPRDTKAEALPPHSFCCPTSLRRLSTAQTPAPVDSFQLAVDGRSTTAAGGGLPSAALPTANFPLSPTYFGAGRIIVACWYCSMAWAISRWCVRSRRARVRNRAGG